MSKIKFNFSSQEYYEKGLVNPQDVLTFKEFLKSEKLPNESDELIIIFLSACENDIEKAKKYAKINYEARKALPEVFDNRDLKNEKILKVWEIIELSVMPQRTTEDYVVIVYRFSDHSASKFHMEAVVKLFLMTVESAAYDGPVSGFIFLIDLKNMTLKHITKLKLSILRGLLKYGSEGLLHHLKCVHYINGGYVLDQLFKIFKAFCKPELLELFRYYPGEIDWNDFYENSISKKCLPVDYGGELESMEEQHKKMWKRLEDLEEYFDSEYKNRMHL